MKIKPTYISLFSSAGIGCYGFKMEEFECVATVELLEKRMKFQQFNQKCKFDSGYISDDITNPIVRKKIHAEMKKHGLDKPNKSLDVIIATPPCQGMSVANHKKNDELGRNSLVVESIKITKELQPKVFIFENVRAFLNTICTDTDGKDKEIKEAILNNLGGDYHIHFEVLNFKNYGCPSSRTRTLVIGTRKDLRELTPLHLFPDYQEEVSLWETIGHLPRLTKMGEIYRTDIYHSFKKYNSEMLDWIKDLKEGESAFDNKDPRKKPHKIVDGKRVINQNKNGDKYRKQIWNKVAPCIHTRNDILSSQNTIHPEDNRVFSIKELMLMMSIPSSFKWTDTPIDKLNKLTNEEKQLFLSKAEMNIRHSIGEAVPTIIFQQIAKKVNSFLLSSLITDRNLLDIIDQEDLKKPSLLVKYIERNKNNFSYSTLLKVAELANSNKNETAAYYTRQDVCYSVIKDLPNASKFKTLRILEPSVGVGNFLPLIIEKYKSVSAVKIDVIDVDENSIKVLKALMKKIVVPPNVEIRFIVADFLLHTFTEKYDIIIGNPPYMKITNNKNLLDRYKLNSKNKQTNNIFAFFLEKSIQLGTYVALIVPKSLINSPEFDTTREIIETHNVQKICDYGESGFKGVKIETISITINTSKYNEENIVTIESYITKSVDKQRQNYIFSKEYPYWLIYRNKYFDEVAKKLKFGIFQSYRDRQITKKDTNGKGKYRVLKSRNIDSNQIRNIKGYDSYIDEINSFGVSKYLNNEAAVLVPNLTYNPRACFLPKNTIVDGSVAILTLKNGSRKVTTKDLEYYNTSEYEKFYRIARNFGTRSLNIDNNSVFFFGILK